MRIHGYIELKSQTQSALNIELNHLTQHYKSTFRSYFEELNYLLRRETRLRHS